MAPTVRPRMPAGRSPSPALLRASSSDSEACSGSSAWTPPRTRLPRRSGFRLGGAPRPSLSALRARAPPSRARAPPARARAPPARAPRPRCGCGLRAGLGGEVLVAAAASAARALRSASLARSSAALTRSSTSRRRRSRSASSRFSWASRSASAARCSASLAARLDLLQSLVGLGQRPLPLLALGEQTALGLLHLAREPPRARRRSPPRPRRGRAARRPPEPRRLHTKALLGLGAGALLGLAAGLRRRLLRRARRLHAWPASIASRVRSSTSWRTRSDSSRARASPPTEALGLLPQPGLGLAAGLLLSLAASLVRGHLDQLLGLALGAADTLLGLALELLRPAQTLLRLTLDSVLLGRDALLVLPGELLHLLRGGPLRRRVVRPGRRDVGRQRRAGAGGLRGGRRCGRGLFGRRRFGLGGGRCSAAPPPSRARRSISSCSESPPPDGGEISTGAEGESSALEGSGTGVGSPLSGSASASARPLSVGSLPSSSREVAAKPPGAWSGSGAIGVRAGSSSAVRCPGETTGARPRPLGLLLLGLFRSGVFCSGSSCSGSCSGLSSASFGLSSSSTPVGTSSSFGFRSSTWPSPSASPWPSPSAAASMVSFSGPCTPGGRLRRLLLLSSCSVGLPSSSGFGSSGFASSSGATPPRPRTPPRAPAPGRALPCALALRRWRSSLRFWRSSRRRFLSSSQALRSCSSARFFSSATRCRLALRSARRSLRLSFCSPPSTSATLATGVFAVSSSVPLASASFASTFALAFASALASFFAARRRARLGLPEPFGAAFPPAPSGDGDSPAGRAPAAGPLHRDRVGLGGVIVDEVRDLVGIDCSKHRRAQSLHGDSVLVHSAFALHPGRRLACLHRLGGPARRALACSPARPRAAGRGPRSRGGGRAPPCPSPGPARPSPAAP